LPGCKGLKPNRVAKNQTETKKYDAVQCEIAEKIWVDDHRYDPHGHDGEHCGFPPRAARRAKVAVCGHYERPKDEQEWKGAKQASLAQTVEKITVTTDRVADVPFDRLTHLALA
jgi:hypothetical protein